MLAAAYSKWQRNSKPATFTSVVRLEGLGSTVRVYNHVVIELDVLIEEQIQPPAKFVVESTDQRLNLLLEQSVVNAGADFEFFHATVEHRNDEHRQHGDQHSADARDCHRDHDVCAAAG